MSKELLDKLILNKKVQIIWKKGPATWEEYRILPEYVEMQQGKLRSPWN